jgi:hypothetical protein
MLACEAWLPPPAACRHTLAIALLAGPVLLPRASRRLCAHRERKRSAECRAASEDYRRRWEAALREQRALVKRLGQAERSAGGGSSQAARAAARKAATEEEYWGEEAGRRFAAQQEELVALREAHGQLQAALAAAVPADTVAR